MRSEDKEHGEISWVNGDVTAYVRTKEFATIWIYTREYSNRLDAKAREKEAAEKKGALKDF